MCGQCAFVAVAGASGARAWLGSRRFAWLTPRRLKAATVSLIAAGVVASSVLIGGSSPAPAKPAPALAKPAPVDAGTAAAAQPGERSP